MVPGNITATNGYTPWTNVSYNVSEQSVEMRSHMNLYRMKFQLLWRLDWYDFTVTTKTLLEIQRKSETKKAGTDSLTSLGFGATLPPPLLEIVE